VVLKTGVVSIYLRRPKASQKAEKKKLLHQMKKNLKDKLTQEISARLYSIKATTICISFKEHMGISK